MTSKYDDHYETGKQMANDIGGLYLGTSSESNRQNGGGSSGLGTVGKIIISVVAVLFLFAYLTN